VKLNHLSTSAMTYAARTADFGAWTDSLVAAVTAHRH
jgi:hypothetical protein